MSQILQNFVKFQKFQLENLVDFEKCCQTHIYLQKSEPIQPKTNNILPKFCQKLATTLRVQLPYGPCRVVLAKGVEPPSILGDERDPPPHLASAKIYVCSNSKLERMLNPMFLTSTSFQFFLILYDFSKTPPEIFKKLVLKS